MLAVFLSPLYVLLNVYIAWRALLWLGTLHSCFRKKSVILIFSIIYGLVSLSPLAAAFGKGGLQTAGRLLSNHWLGTLLYLLLFMLIFDLGRIIVCLLRHQSIRKIHDFRLYRISGTVVFAAVLILTIYGSVHAYHVKKNTYEVTIEKEAPIDELTIALVADLHLGTNVGMTHVNQMKAIIEEMQPDLIVYAGDIFDNDYDAIRNPDQICEVLSGLESTYGSYACWGNHDIQEKILAGFTFSSADSVVTSDPRMDAFLEKAGITLLEDETVLIDDTFYLTGRLDASCYEKSGIVRKLPAQLTEELDQTKPIIVMDHQPAQLQELSQAGVDLTLSGHVHDGQTFPMNYTVKMKWDNSCGYAQIDAMHDIVTSGLGVWGPAVRVGTDCEVVEVKVSFK